jgi:hypothetical protein
MIESTIVTFTTSFVFLHFRVKRACATSPQGSRAWLQFGISAKVIFIVKSAPNRRAAFAHGLGGLAKTPHFEPGANKHRYVFLSGETRNSERKSHCADNGGHRLGVQSLREGVLFARRLQARGDSKREEIYIPFWQIPWPEAGIGVRTAGDPDAMVKSIAAAVHSIDPEIALGEPRSMNEVRDLVLSNDRFTLILFVAFAIVALLLAALGVYGVMSFSVAQCAHEIAE